MIFEFNFKYNKLIVRNTIYSLKLLWLTLTQIQSACEIEFLPVYVPSKEEEQNPKMYANNVRKVMAKYVWMPFI